MSTYHILLVLNTLNFLIDLNSSRWLFGTWATSSSLSFPSYSIRVPPLTSARVLLVTWNVDECHSLVRLLGYPLKHVSIIIKIKITSMINSFWFSMNCFSMDKSTVAPMLSILDMKQTVRPSRSINSSKRPELANAW